jgi:hypothetical protein
MKRLAGLAVVVALGIPGTVAAQTDDAKQIQKAAVNGWQPTTRATPQLLPRQMLWRCLRDSEP